CCGLAPPFCRLVPSPKLQSKRTTCPSGSLDELASKLLGDAGRPTVAEKAAVGPWSGLIANDSKNGLLPVLQAVVGSQATGESTPPAPIANTDTLLAPPLAT